MYDISQLNDMVVPELQDIAEQLAIPNYKKIDKQELINKILDNQSIMSAETKGNQDEKPKRKRTLKVTSAVAKEDMGEVEKAEPKSIKKFDAAPDKKRGGKKVEEETDEEELQPITDEQTTVPAAIASLLQEEDIQQQQPELQQADNAQQSTNQNKQYQQRRDAQVFNIEFDGIVK